MKRIGILTVAFLLLLAGVSFAAQKSYQSVTMENKFQRTSQVRVKEMPKGEVKPTVGLKAAAPRPAGLPGTGLKAATPRSTVAPGGLKAGVAVAQKAGAPKAAVAPKFTAPKVNVGQNPGVAAPKMKGASAVVQPKAAGVKAGGGFKFPTAPKFK